MQISFAIHSLSAPLMIAFAFLILLVALVVKQRKRHGAADSNYKLPPGPWKLPLIGNLHQLIWALSDPWRVLRDLAREHGPIMQLKIGEISAVVISSSRLAKEVMKTQDSSFLDRPKLQAANILFYGGKDIVFAPYGDYWRQMRKICTTELLSGKVVKSFATVRDQEVLRMIQTCRSAAKGIDMSCQFSLLTNAVLCRAAFGEKFNGMEELLALLKDQMEVFAQSIMGDIFPSVQLLISFFLGDNRKLRRMQKRVDFIFDSVIHQRKKQLPPNSSTNLLDVLIQLQRNGGLQVPIDDTNIKAIIFEIFFAGSDSTSVVLEWAFSEMMKNPRIMQKAQNEVRSLVHLKDDNETIKEADLEGLGYLKMVIKETLRLHGPGILIPRQCRKSCEIDGYTIPLKTKVIVNTWAIGRDPDTWNDPESFIPERFEDEQGSMISFTGAEGFQLLPFGGGRRVCPGMLFAMAIIELVLASLLYHFNWQIGPGTKQEYLDMTPSGSVGRRKHSLFATPTSTK